MELDSELYETSTKMYIFSYVETQNMLCFHLLCLLVMYIFCLVNYLDISVFMQYLAAMTCLILIMFRNFCYPLISITFLLYFPPVMAHYTGCLICTFPRQTISSRLITLLGLP